MMVRNLRTVGESFQQRRRHERRGRADRESSKPGRRSGELAALAKRKPGDPHPFAVGNATIQRRLTMVRECAQAGLASSR
jgi:hypothetical protein